MWCRMMWLHVPVLWILSIIRLLKVIIKHHIVLKIIFENYMNETRLFKIISCVIFYIKILFFISQCSAFIFNLLKAVHKFFTQFHILHGDLIPGPLGPWVYEADAITISTRRPTAVHKLCYVNRGGKVWALALMKSILSH